MYGKKLAYIAKVNEIREIPNADKIELATVMDYTVVVKKGEYKPGDLALYVEVGSILPDGLSPEDKEKYDSVFNGTFFKDRVASEAEIKEVLAAIQAKSKYPYFEFLRQKHFRITNWKLNKFGVVSQGILFKPEELGITKVKEGLDYTEQFNITEPVEDDEEAGVSGQKDGWFLRKLMRYAWFRALRNRKRIVESWDPSFPGKSDEENVQKLYTRMFNEHKDEEWVATEKLEGQNISIFSENYTKGIFFRKEDKRIGVCSRTRRLRENGTGKNFWRTVKRLHLDEKIKNIPGEWWCRGEHCGPGIQGNIYKLEDTEVIFFDFYRKEYEIGKNGKPTSKFKWVKLNYEESIAFAKQWDLPFVPVLDEHYKLPEGCVNEKGVQVSGADIMLQQSDKNTVFGKNLAHKREGFVLRLRNNYNVSFKVKNPNYSI